MAPRYRSHPGPYEERPKADDARALRRFAVRTSESLMFVAAEAVKPSAGRPIDWWARVAFSVRHTNTQSIEQYGIIHFVYISRISLIYRESNCLYSLNEIYKGASTAATAAVSVNLCMPISWRYLSSPKLAHLGELRWGIRGTRMELHATISSAVSCNPWLNCFAPCICWVRTIVLPTRTPTDALC